VIVVYVFRDGVWRAVGVPDITPPPPPDSRPYGTGTYGTGPYGK